MFDSQGSFIPYDRYIFVPYILLISVNLCKIAFHDNELKLFELHENSSVFRAIPVYQVVLSSTCVKFLSGLVICTSMS